MSWRNYLNQILLKSNKVLIPIQFEIRDSNHSHLRLNRIEWNWFSDCLHRARLKTFFRNSSNCRGNGFRISAKQDGITQHRIQSKTLARKGTLRRSFYIFFSFAELFRQLFLFKFSFISSFIGTNRQSCLPAHSGAETGERSNLYCDGSSKEETCATSFVKRTKTKQRFCLFRAFGWHLNWYCQKRSWNCLHGPWKSRHNGRNSS